MTKPDLTVIVPTFNEAPNVSDLVDRVAIATQGLSIEILFVDDSRDETPAVIAAKARSATVPVRLIHREAPVGGLSGAVLEGMKHAKSTVCVVMDGDLQHPPEVIRDLYRQFVSGSADVVVASRYAAGGSSDGLANIVRDVVSRATTLLTKAMFPLRLRDCTDPMTGFFLIDISKVDLERLAPRGFKILLEILARTPLRVSEVSFTFAERGGGESKASIRQGAHFLLQLTALRFGKMSAFALIGAIGAVANLAIMFVLTQLGMGYIWAAMIAAEATIVGNFLLQERFVFREMLDQASNAWTRFAKSFTFNNAEALIRIPLLALLVESWHISSVLAAAITLALAFVARFAFHALVVYAPKRPRGTKTERILRELDSELAKPGEL